MPRRPRYAPAGQALHITNRGVERRQLFFNDADYREYLRLLRRGKDRHPVKVFGVCLMPNHFHALVQPEAEGALSAYLQWVQCCYACDLRARTGTSGNGHVFQQRFWSHEIYDELHFLNVLRYIETNPLAGKLVERSEDWQWSSLSLRSTQDSLVDPLPLVIPTNWCELVNRGPAYEEVD